MIQTQLEVGSRIPDFLRTKPCPELQVPHGIKDVPKTQLLKCRGISAPWGVPGSVALPLSAVRNGGAWVNKRGLTFGIFPGGELESKNKIKATQTLGFGSSQVEGLLRDF